SHLVARGHEVTVAGGFPHHPGGRLLDGYRKRLLLEERRGGVRVVRGWHVTTASPRVAFRAAVMVSQAVGTTMAALLAGGKPDVVVSYGPPLVGPLLAAAVARARRAPLVTVIYDLYPDIAVETGRVKNPAVIAAARWAERRVYAASDRIVVLSEGFRRTLAARGVEPGKVEIVPVWLDPAEVRPAARENAWRTEQAIPPGTFVVLYAGTIGIVSGAEVMVEVADRLRGEPDLLFLFVGEGQVKAAIEEATRARGLPNVRFLPLQDRARLGEVQATADLSVVTLAPGRARTSVPSKVVGYLAAGRPVLASVDEDSDTAACVRAGPCGVVVPPADAAGLAEALLALKRDPQRRAALGGTGRATFERDFAAPAVLDRFASLLERVAEGRA
ncbi:MAG TPA: glycosyltransferase family 4 protein, partial [Anaeromyxobacter sp.]|nr:glycosyltransferase family 4 protein [Anaeromyxobacter sp.]